jgi:hypothetical protein
MIWALGVCSVLEPSGSGSRVQEATFPMLISKVQTPMRMYIFKSETTKDLRAFAGDPAGAKLPGSHAPWTATGVVRADEPPPHTLSRETIEKAIESKGFQLWRLRQKA